VTNRKVRSIASLGLTEKYCVETSGYSRGAQGVDRALPKSRPESHSEEEMTTMLRTRQERGHQEGASKTTHGWFY
jgi:hypothetical protein